MIVWRKSSRSGSATDEVCVEVAKLSSGIGIRDSKNRTAGHVSLNDQAFASLVHKIKRGALDRP